MKKVLFIMAAALMTMTQCKKQETSPATPAADTIKMTVTAGPGRTDINTETGAITWSAGDKLYVSDGDKWLGSLTLIDGADESCGTFSGNVAIGGGTTPCHFFYLGNDNGMTEPTAGTSTGAVISLASQDGTLAGAMKYHIGYGTTDVKVESGEYQGYVVMNTKIAIAHINFTTDGTTAYTGSVTMGGTGVSNTLSVTPAGIFSGSGDGGIAIDKGDGTTGERYVTLIPTGETSIFVAFTGDATGSMAFANGIVENKFYGMKDAVKVTVISTKVPVESVSLNKTELSLEVGGTETLTAMVSPDDATDQSVTWSSNATGVATVSDAGLVTAVAAGTATITVTTVDGNKTATCTVTVKPATYVDLGLPSGLLWATCNVGADSPEGYGWYFMWGSTTNGGDSNCSWANCPGNGGNSSYSETAIAAWDATHLTNDVLKPEVDAASVNWGGDWRMPTTAEWQELCDNTTSTWTTENGVYGCKFASKTNAAKYIFLPAAGFRDGTNVADAGSSGRYWSGSLYSFYPYNAYDMYFDSGGVYPQDGSNRYYGYSVRPVR